MFGYCYGVLTWSGVKYVATKADSCAHVVSAEVQAAED